MTTERALLDGIRAAPADDAPRLVYADWLDDRGGPGDADRAAFIRVQCRLAGLTEDDPEYEDLLERQGELLARHRDAWLAPLPASARAARHVFRRGFVDEVELSAAAFCKDGGRLLDRTPLGWLVLDRWALGFEERPPDFGRMSDRARRLAACEHLGRLRGLRVHDGWVTPFEPALVELLASRHFDNLTHLPIGGNPLDRDTFRTLGRARWLDQLESLDVSSNRAGDWVVGQLANKAGLTNLRELVLGGFTYIQSRPCGKTAGGLGELLARSKMRRLRRLDLNGRHIHNAGLACLADWPGLATVEDLGLGRTALEAGDARPLAASEHAERLTRLDLADTRVSDADLSALAASRHLGRLRRLNIGHTTRAEVTRGPRRRRRPARGISIAAPSAARSPLRKD